MTDKHHYPSGVGVEWTIGEALNPPPPVLPYVVMQAVCWDVDKDRPRYRNSLTMDMGL